MTQNKEYVVTTDLNTAGRISYWRLSGDLDLVQLAAVWTAQGLDKALLPKPPGDGVALGRAMHEQSGTVTSQVRLLARPLARQAWALVEETLVKDSLSYETLLSVKFEKGGPVFTRDHASHDRYNTLVASIRSSYDNMKGTLTTNDVSSWLVKLAGQYQSVPLRDTGGIYFVPKTHVDTWDRIVRAITKVSAHSIFQIPALKTAEAIAAITDAVTQECEAIALTIEREMQAGKLGDRALQTRRKECEALLAKVGAYDTLLDVQLKCRERVEVLQATIVATVLAEGSEQAA